MTKYLPFFIFIVIITGCGESSIDGTTNNTSTCSDYSALVSSLTVNDTGQQNCYDENGSTITCPSTGESLYGQDGQYTTTAANFVVCDDSVVVDNNTGLMWQKAYNETRVSYTDAENACANLELGSFSDWRLPDVKEAFSIANFAGTI